MCKQRVRLAGDPEAAADSDSDSPPAETEREPLIQRRQRRYGATAPVSPGRGGWSDQARGTGKVPGQVFLKMLDNIVAVFWQILFQKSGIPENAWNT